MTVVLPKMDEESKKAITIKPAQGIPTFIYSLLIFKKLLKRFSVTLTRLI